ncbi:MAG: YbhB/YbcL family Raf kinase inhibitor-like protein [Chloroflexi bacterium]|nr:YbhB/YbcL family Raf kinase inhibitor-like protein [Chloroflexota bacterium]
MKGLSLASIAGAMLLTLAACGGDGQAPDVLAPVEGFTAFVHLTSPAFESGSQIPTVFTCDGDDRSPALAWESIPTGTQSLALIMEDPDAPGGTWSHWVAYGLGTESSGLSEATADGMLEGKNDFGRTGYGGPCPPTGSDHRYFFRLYALDSAVDLEPGAIKSELFEAINGHVLGVGQIMGTYAR